MSTSWKLFRIRPHSAVRLALLAGLGLATAVTAQTTTCLVFDLGPAAFNIGGITEPNAAGALFIGGMSTRGTGAAWTAGLPALPLPAAPATFTAPAARNPVNVRTLGVPPSQAFLAPTPALTDIRGAALWAGGASAAVRVGYTGYIYVPNFNPRNLSFDHATAWNLAGANYVATDLDPTGVYFNSVASGIVACTDTSLLAFGQGQNNSPYRPVKWKQAARAGAIAFTRTELSPLNAAGNSFINGASRRSDTDTLVGCGAGPMAGTAIGSTWATYWQGNTPINLNNPANLNAPPAGGGAALPVPNGRNANRGGNAFGVASFTDAGNAARTDDIVVGAVTRSARGAANGLSDAFLWVSPVGGAGNGPAGAGNFTPFNLAATLSAALPPAAPAPVYVYSVAQCVNAAQTVGGYVAYQQGPANAIIAQGFIAVNSIPGNPNAGTWSVSRVVPDVNSAGWTITDVIKINDAGVMIGFGRAAGKVRRVLLIPNPTNATILGATAVPANG